MAVTAYAIGASLAVVAISLLLPLLTSPLNGIPGPLPAKFTNLWRFFTVRGGKAHKVHRALHDKHGKVVRLGPNCVSINDPDLIKVIYSSKAKWPKSDFYAIHDNVVGKDIIENVFSTRNEDYHTAMTKAVHPVFTVTNVLKFEKLMDDTIQDFRKHMNEKFVATGKACDIGTWLHYLAWDIVGKLTFSRTMGFMDTNSDVGHLIEFGEKALEYQAPIGQIAWLDKWLDKNLTWRNGPPGPAVAIGFAFESVQKRQAGEAVRDAGLEGQIDMLDEFIDLKRKDPENFSDNHIFAFTVANVIAGSDTTAIELRAVTYFLAKNPDKKKKLQAELDAAPDKDGILQWRDASKLPYLDAVIREAHRMHPAVGLSLERKVPDGGFKLPDGRYLPAGTIIGVNPSVIHYDRDVYGEDVDSYRPERWLKGGDEKQEVYQARVQRMRETDLTFGYGKRACIGKNVAVTEIFKIVGTLFKHYDLELVNPKKEWHTNNKWFNIQSDFDCYIKAR